MNPIGTTLPGLEDVKVPVTLAIPSVMIVLSLTLKPRANRWINIIIGVL